MNLKEKESLISRQERAVKQQELLEKRRRARAEYNVSREKPEKKSTEQKTGKSKHKNMEGNRRIFAERTDPKASKGEVPANHTEDRVSVSQWFLSICWLKIPVIGFIYALILALSRRAPYEKRNFARGYILYRVLVFLLAVTVLYVVYRVGLGFVEELLSYLPV